MDQLIGRPYNAASWNCATLVAERLGLQLTPGEEWAIEFVRRLRRQGQKIKQPEHGAVVVMSHPCGALHVGLIDGARVLHADDAAGTCRTSLAIISNRFPRVRYYRWHS